MNQKISKFEFNCKNDRQNAEGADDEKINSIDNRVFYSYLSRMRNGYQVS
jgi:hypothetical protein